LDFGLLRLAAAAPEATCADAELPRFDGPFDFEEPPVALARATPPEAAAFLVVD